MKASVLLMSIFMLIVACKSQDESNEIINISVEQLKSKLNDKIQLVDVRTPTEWEKGIIENAIKISVTSDDFETKALEILDIKIPVYVYCKSGGRSLIAAKMLLEKGFKAYNVEGGYIEWIEKNK